MTTMAINGKNGSPSAHVIEQVLMGGDLAKLTSEQKVSYYNRVCESLGLNPVTQPFAYIRLNGKEVLYAKKDCTEQLRKIHGVSLIIVSREVSEGVYVVTARATDGHGRTDESVGAVPIEGLKGEARANAMMKAETKAKRRVTMSLCGLGMLDETEVDSIPSAMPIEVEHTPSPKAPAAVAHLAPLTTALPLSRTSIAAVAAPEQSTASSVSTRPTFAELTGRAGPLPTTALSTAEEIVTAVFPGAYVPNESEAAAKKVRLLAIKMGEIGVREKAARLEWISARVGRKVETSKALTDAELDALLTRADEEKAGAP